MIALLKMMDHGIVDKDGVWRSSHLALIVRAAASVMAGLLMAVALIAVWRRCAGAFQAPLPFQTLLCVGVVAIGPTFAIRYWWRLATNSLHISAMELVWTFCIPSVSLLTILSAISVPGTSILGLSLIGLLFITGELAVYRPPRFNATETPPSPIPISDITEPEPVEEMVPVVNVDIIEKGLDPHVSQQLIRCRTEDGQDCLKGWIRVDIPTGHRSQNVHLAFCPAFEATPTIDVHPESDQPSCRIKMVQCLPYGAHFEVKLPKPSPQNETFTLHFQARSASLEPQNIEQGMSNVEVRCSRTIENSG